MQAIVTATTGAVRVRDVKRTIFLAQLLEHYDMLPSSIQESRMEVSVMWCNWGFPATGRPFRNGEACQIRIPSRRFTETACHVFLGVPPFSHKPLVQTTLPLSIFSGNPTKSLRRRAHQKKQVLKLVFYRLKGSLRSLTTLRNKYEPE